ncbi:MAG TPA: ParB N-terminal domain-containing protein [Synechococcales cyanobacterium M55_K2018_004]|nr:ParB N-terminal domain-containing protein [Synechococcales cyanobacterium M55_K2018_004]
MRIEELPITKIRRPLFRQNDQTKVAELMASIQQIGLQEPIDVLEVDGEYYGFSGCHRFEACTRLGHETIRCKVRRAPKSILKMHLA